MTNLQEYSNTAQFQFCLSANINTDERGSHGSRVGFVVQKKLGVMENSISHVVR